jgi:hypothetical protein
MFEGHGGECESHDGRNKKQIPRYARNDRFLVGLDDSSWARLMRVAGCVEGLDAEILRRLSVGSG